MADPMFLSRIPFPFAVDPSRSHLSREKSHILTPTSVTALFLFILKPT